MLHVEPLSHLPLFMAEMWEENNLFSRHSGRCADVKVHRQCVYVEPSVMPEHWPVWCCWSIAHEHDSCCHHEDSAHRFPRSLCCFADPDCHRSDTLLHLQCFTHSLIYINHVLLSPSVAPYEAVAVTQEDKPAPDSGSAHFSILFHYCWHNAL